MKLSDLLENLSFGEMSNLSLAGDGNGTIHPSGQPKIVLYANDGLLRLYSRFVLKEEDLLLHIHDSITNYHLLPKFAVNYTPLNAEDNEPIRYITDLPAERFAGDVIKVLKVYDDNGKRLPLNDVEDTRSVFTPQTLVLQIVNPVADEVYSVQYQARHPRLSGDLEELIYLPDVLQDALRAFIAYRVFSHMNTQDGTSKGQEHLVNYETLCKNVLDGDLVGTSISTTNTRFESRGWV